MCGLVNKWVNPGRKPKEKIDSLTKHREKFSCSKRIIGSAQQCFEAEVGNLMHKDMVKLPIFM